MYLGHGRASNQHPTPGQVSKREESEYLRFPQKGLHGFNIVTRLFEAIVVHIEPLCVYPLADNMCVVVHAPKVLLCQVQSRPLLMTEAWLPLRTSTQHRLRASFDQNNCFSQIQVR